MGLQWVGHDWVRGSRVILWKIIKKTTEDTKQRKEGKKKKKDYGTEHKSTILFDSKWVNGIHKSEFYSSYTISWCLPIKFSFHMCK